MMKRAITLILMLGMLAGCGPSALQIQAEIAYYEAVASITKNQAAKPLVRIVPSDPTKAMMMDNVGAIEVYQQVEDKGIQQYVQKDFNEPMWRFFTTMASVVTPWVGAYYMVDAVAGAVGSGTTYNYHNQVGDNATGQFRVTGNTTATGGSATGIHDQTSVPTIMEPSVHIIEQPAPVIVTQPEPIVIK